LQPLGSCLDAGNLKKRTQGVALNLQKLKWGRGNIKPLGEKDLNRREGGLKKSQKERGCLRKEEREQAAVKDGHEGLLLRRKSSESSQKPV